LQSNTAPDNPGLIVSPFIWLSRTNARYSSPVPIHHTRQFTLRWRTAFQHPLACALGLVSLISSSLAGTFSISENVEEVLKFTLAPAAITASSNGDWLVALDQREKPNLRAARILRSGEVIPFPDEWMSTASAEARLPLDSLEAIAVSQDGIVWMLDNGRRSETTPKLVGWNIDKERLHRVVYLSPPAVIPSSFCTDLVLDPSAPFAYLADPANGQDAAIIVADLESGLCRRVLQGIPCVQPDPSVALPISALSERSTVRLDGTTTITQCGVDSLAIDRRGEWLYLSALQSRTLQRLPAKLLRNAKSSAPDLAKAIEHYATKPPSVSMAIDSKGNLYLGDSANRGIGIIEPKNRSYQLLVSDARLLWPDSLTFGQDGRLYFFSPNRPLPKLGDKASGNAKPSYSLFRTRTPASGRSGD
jgi:hypothetical protein